MIAVEVKGRDTKFTWEIVGIYTAPNEDMRDIERLNFLVTFFNICLHED
jgi:hypothetical protein